MYNSNKYQLPVATVISVTATAYHSDEEGSDDDVRVNNIIEVEVSPSHKMSQRRLARSFGADDDNEPIYNPPDEENVKEFLSTHKWPSGLQDALINNCKNIPIRFIIADDSGSMMEEDGHMLLGTAGSASSKIVPCTRWAELSASLKFHAELAHQSKAPTEFRLLNNSEPILVGHHSDEEGEGRDALFEVLEAAPCGQTPLCQHIQEVVAHIESIEEELLANDQKACLVIASDGAATDGDITQAMKPLQHLPVWVVIRLCTDEDKVVRYWNNVDAQLDLDMDVLDDMTGEAVEVFAHNPWLTYSDPLHKLREFGVTLKETDLVDETLLSHEQMAIVCSLLILGDKVQELPHPEEDWAGFLTVINKHNQLEAPVFDPISLTMKPWIDVRKLCEKYQRKPVSAACTVS